MVTRNQGVYALLIMAAVMFAMIFIPSAPSQTPESTSDVTPRLSPAPVSSEAASSPAPSSQATATPEPTPFCMEQARVYADAVLENAFIYQDLVDMKTLSDRFVFDIVYAHSGNFTGVPIYDRALCLAHGDMAHRLLTAQYELDALGTGLRLLIYDIYRPTEMQRILRELTPEHQKKFVARPGPRANHTKAAAVDCALAAESGVPLEKPSGFDELNERAHINYAGGTQEARDNRDFLIDLMSRHGLVVASSEWWHFNLAGVENYPVLDVSFEEFERAAAGR